MKKAILFSVITIMFASCSIKYNSDLYKMGEALKQHFKDNDRENNTLTTLDLVEPISYDKLEDAQKEKPEDVYLSKFYVKGYWKTEGSSLVYNMNDTISCYFDTNLRYLRMKGK